MPSPWVRSSLAALLVLALTAPAWAQTGGAGGTGGGTGTQGLGTCSGMMSGTVGLAFPDGNGGFTAIQPNSITYAYNYAECACTPPPAQQLHLQIKLNGAGGKALPSQYQQASSELWVGTGCDNYATRYSTTTTTCEKLRALNTTDFTQFSTAGSNGILLPLPGNALASPVQHTCTTQKVNNQAYIFIYTDPMNPIATCTLPLTETNAGPSAPTGVQSLSGDTAVTLTWTTLTTGTVVPQNYQILCSDDNGNPITSSPPKALYSTCVNGMLDRRTLPTGGSTPVTTTGDGGVSRLPESGPHPEGQPHPLAIVDMAGADMTGVDMAGADMTGTGGDMAMNPVTFKFLANLDPRYVCSDQIAATATSQRISGLVNNRKYHFVLLAIDQFGNATPAPDVSETPHAVEDLYRRYRDKGGAPGGCFIATAAFGSYESGWVKVLREFRDEVLLPTDVGHDFVEWYYAHSPPAAAWIARHAVARALVRVLLVPVIGVAAAWLYSTPWQKALALLLVMAWLFRRRLAAAWRGGAA